MLSSGLIRTKPSARQPSSANRSFPGWEEIEQRFLTGHAGPGNPDRARFGCPAGHLPCIRARLQSCRKRSKIGEGHSPCVRVDPLIGASRGSAARTMKLAAQIRASLIIVFQKPVSCQADFNRAAFLRKTSRASATEALATPAKCLVQRSTKTASSRQAGFAARGRNRWR
jgi:hypothetical protein